MGRETTDQKAKRWARKKARRLGRGEGIEQESLGGKRGNSLLIFGRRHNSLEAKVTRIGRRLFKWGFCNLHILHFFYTVLLSFLADSRSIICCLGTITRYSMTPCRFGNDCKFQTLLFSYVSRLQSDSDVHLSQIFANFFSTNSQLNLIHLSLFLFSLFFLILCSNKR